MHSVVLSLGAGAVIRVVHVIAGLEADGAETVLHRLTSGMDHARFENKVISLTGRGPMAMRLEASGVPVRALGMRPGVPNPFHLQRLTRWLREWRPNLVQTWMYHADLLGGVAARLIGKPVVWGIHHTNLKPDQNKRLTIWTARMCALLSRQIPDRIVCCSEASRQAHAEFGYASQRMEVIPNGFDVQQFHTDADARSSMRKELGITDETPLIGMAARFHRQKGHRNFVEAAARLHAQVPGAHFVLCGKGTDEDNTELKMWIQQEGTDLRRVCHLLGSREDMPRFYSALDVATLASRSEAFPMAIGEAMACGIPCVVTNVGDSAMIVGNTGKVVPADDPRALAEAWQSLLNTSPAVRKQMGQAARDRIQEQFSLSAIVKRYQELYVEVLAPAGSASEGCSSLASLAG